MPPKVPLRLGVHLVLRHPQEALGQLLRARAAGIQEVELSPVGRQWRMGDFRHLCECLEEVGVTLTALGCYLNPMRPTDPGLTGADWSLFLLLVQAFPDLTGKPIVFWSGTNSDRLHREHPLNRSLEAVASLLALLEQAIALCERRGAKVLVRVHRSHVLSGAEVAAELFERFDPSQLGLAVSPEDLLADLPSETWNQILLEGTRSLARWVDLVHLVDLKPAPESEPEIVPPGAGILDYRRWLAELRGMVSAPWIIDQCPPQAWPRVNRFLQDTL